VRGWSVFLKYTISHIIAIHGSSARRIANTAPKPEFAPFSTLKTIPDITLTTKYPPIRQAHASAIPAPSDPFFWSATGGVVGPGCTGVSDMVTAPQ
jgi:hypothetical protein